MLSPHEFAARLRKHGVIKSASTISRWCKAGLPGAVKAGGTWEIPEETVQVVLAGSWDTRLIASTAGE